MKKQNRVLRGIGTTMLAGSIALGSFTSVNLPNPVTVEASAYQDVILKQGMRHQDVVQLKKDLAKAGFTVPGKGTNLFGAQTEKQVKAFQNYYSLTADGIVGNQVKATLNAVTNSPLQKGKRHKDTVQLKKDLAAAGFKVAGKGTNLYGTGTEKQVKAFQKKYKLVQNGIADSVTLKKLESVANPTLENGVRHQDVVQLKKDLAKAGFKVPGKGTSLFGKQTEVQVKAFQKYYGLSQSGKIDGNTDKKIKEVVNSPLQNGKRDAATVQLKKDLAAAGFKVAGKGTNLYGKGTEKQVKAFQKAQGLVQNGIADSVTLQKLDQVANATLENGVRHQDVVQLKKDLAKAGFKVPGKGTTLFGNATEKQVKAFQKYYGLSQNGKIDNKTDKKIKEVVNSPLQNGKRHKDTVQLKRDLAAAGFAVAGKGTNLYGKGTEKQVKAFQKANGLVQNGIADSVTLDKLNQLANPTLENGVRHQDVVQLKKDLAKAGFKVPGKGTNFFGNDTEEQVKAFQKYYGLNQSGKVDNNTEKKINEVVNSPLQNGKRDAATVQLKKDLATVGFTVPGNNTTLYGKQTEKQVKAFQKKYKLVQNGIADEVTLAKLQEVVKAIVEKDNIETKQETKTETIAYTTKQEDDPTLEKGKTKVKTVGKNGKAEVTYEVIYKSGKETARKEISRKTVVQPVQEVIKVGTRIDIESISLSDTELTLTEGENITLAVSILPENATNKDLLWSSSNEDIVSVNNHGVVQANNSGEATITVTDNSGTITSDVTVTVKKLTIESIENITNEITQFDEYALPTTVSALMNNGTKKEYAVSWSNNDIDTSILGEQYFEGTVEGYEGSITLTLKVNKYDPQLQTNAYSAITINNLSKSLSLNINNKGSKSVNIDKIEIYEKGKLYTTYTPQTLNESGIDTVIQPGKQWGISISSKFGIWLDNSYVKYYVSVNDVSYEYENNL